MAGGQKVAVVIVNYNGGELLERALDCLHAQSRKPDEIYVVDNDSRDGSREGAAQRDVVTPIDLDFNAGFAAANNLAIERASDCEWIALLNQDAFPEPDWLARLLNAAERHPECAGFAAKLVLDANPALLDGTGDLYATSGFAWRRDHGALQSEAQHPEEEVLSACAAAALFRRDALVACGAFDQSYFCYQEDIDLGLRLQLNGYGCLYVPSAVARHAGSVSSGRQSDFYVFHTQRNLVWTYFKNMPGRLVWLYLPQHVLLNAMALVWYSARGNMRAVWRAKLAALRGLPAALRKRRTIQRERQVTPSELRAKLVRGLGGYRAAAGRTTLS